MLLTSSCAQALERAGILFEIRPGDEIIMPRYTFVSTVNAFVWRGANIVFVDIHPDMMNIDEALIEAAITSRTKAIVLVHYAGVACEMDFINDIARRHNLFVIEDAAQRMMSAYRDKAVGTFGHFAAYSFHETKNVTSGGEGGLLIINDERFVHRAEIIREKGTNRSQFFRGLVDKYTWVDVGSSYLLSEIQAAYLWGQLEVVDQITSDRLATWRTYFDALSDLKSFFLFELPKIPAPCVHDAHMFYLKCKDLTERTAMLKHLKQSDVLAVFHYVPLQSSPAGMRFGRLPGEDRYTSVQSDRLLRLPLWYGMNDNFRQCAVIDSVRVFFV